MRWGIEYELASGMIGVCLFAADDETVAQTYVADMHTKFGHTRTFHLQQLSEEGGIAELYRLFPRISPAARLAVRSG